MKFNEVSKQYRELEDLEPGHPLVQEAPAWRRYLGALLCIAVAFAIRYWLTPVLGEELPFMLFIAASLVAAWYGGAAAGTVALLLGLFLADYFFLSRPPRIPASHPSETLYFVRYLFTASLGIGLIETLHRSRRRLRKEIARREQIEEELLKAQGQLRAHAGQLEDCVSQRTAQLAETVKYLENLLYHIGHNLRAPLRAMEGFATVLVDEYASKLDAVAREYSAHISDAAKRMDDLIQDLLAYGRLGYVQCPLGVVRLDTVLDRVLFRLGFEIRTRKAEIQVDGHLPAVHANSEMLEQVLTNLVENAIKFVTPANQPVVRLWAERRGPQVRVWIQDNGPGIPAFYCERIFGVFETLHPVQGRQGTGIGLAIVKQGMQRMGGNVGLESEPGNGSRFWIELLAADAAIPAEEATSPALPLRRNGKLAGPAENLFKGTRGAL